MLFQTKGIVLHHIKYSDNSVIAHFYTEKFGRQSYIVSGIRGKNSKRKINLLQPLFLLNLSVQHKEKRELQRIKEFSNVIAFQSIPYDISKRSIALFLAELLYKILKEEESNLDLFNFLQQAIRLFDEMKEGKANFHLIFLAQVSKFLGIAPAGSFQKKTPIFDLQNGTFVQVPPSHPFYWKSKNSEQFSKLMNSSFGDIANYRLDKDRRHFLLKQLLQYYQIHFDNFQKINSLDILRQVFE